MSDFPLPETTLVQFFEGDGSVSVTQTKLDRYAVETVDLDLELSERFRWLAINLANQTLVNGWSDLQLIYDRAVSANPRNEFCYHSIGVTALELDG
jgi:hypothetical protein